MKSIMHARTGFFLVLALLIFFLASPTMTTPAAAQPDKPAPAAWKPVQAAIDQGLPKSAITEIEKGLPAAIQAGDFGLVVRFLATRATLQGQLEGQDEVHRIVKLQADLETAPQPAQPIIRAIMANWFWNYYSQNQWRFQDRTEIDSKLLDSDKPAIIKSSEDIATWSRQRIINQSALLFEAALNAEDGSQKTLRGTAIGDYSSLLIRGSAPDEYRPTLYDFVVAEAIEFYVDADKTYAGPVDRFELEVGTPVFADVREFIAWQVPETDARSPLRRATTLYQQWLAFHLEDENRAALIDTDLHRLEFANAHGTGKDVKSAYEEALRAFVRKHAESEISTRAQYHLATLARERDDQVQARQIALAAIAAHPKSFGAQQCQALVEQIEAPSIDIATERVWNPELDDSARPRINVNYRNVTQVHFRLVPLDYQALRQSSRRPEQLSQEQREELLARKAIAAWSESLPETADYRQASQSVAARLDVPRGSYYLIASTNENFPINQDFTALTGVWVSGLSIVIETNQSEGLFIGHVVDGKTGTPIAKAKVDVWASPQINRGRQGPAHQTTLTSDKNGRFEFPAEALREITFYASHAKDALLSQPYYMYGQRRHGQVDEQDRDVNRSFFFTDRAIYRPGQMLRYKIICTRSNQLKGEYEVAANAQVNVDFLDANGKVMHQEKLRCNDLGSCHGSFNLPSGGLTGQITLRTTGEFQGTTSINVEEYKRPKFEVKLESPKDRVRLGEPVTITGAATAYTGAAIDGAKVSYRVVRNTELPPWWWYRCWWMPPAPMPPQVIAEGETQTDESGNFTLTFDAVPDNSVDRESEPKFRYTIHADVIDMTGETRRDSSTVLVGYTMIEATMSTSSASWLTDQAPVEIKVATRTLQGDPATAKVKVQVHSLQAPKSIGRQALGNSRMWDRSGNPSGSKLEGEQDEVRPEEPNSWPLGEVVKTIELTTDDAGNASFQCELEAGHYRAVLSAVDSAGQSVTALLPLLVIDPNAERSTLKIANVFAVEKNSLQPGETFRAVWGSGYETAQALVEVLHRGKTLQSYWTPKHRTQVEITQEVDESMRGGFTVRVWMVRENRLYLNEQRVDVPWANKDLTVRWERFVSKLKPGQQETWTAKIESQSGDSSEAMKRATEMVATLYVASLDAFLPHHFPNGFGVFYQDYLRSSISNQNAWEILRQLTPSRSQLSGSGALTYHSYPPELQGRSMMFSMMRRGGGGMESMSMAADAMPAAAPMMAKSAAGEDQSQMEGVAGGMAGEPPADEKQVDLSDVSPRKNLNETAFFFPALTADENGVVSISFTMPEALTRWQLLGFAHTKDLAGGLIRDTAVTSKELMVQPNPPRTLREGDEIEMTVKVSNQSATVQTGSVALEFADARTGDSVNEQIENANVRQSFEIPAGQSRTFSWPIRIPDGLGFLTYKAVGSTGRLSDGEEGYLAVLSRKILVHESIALPIDGKETKTFTLEKLIKLDPDSIRNESLTVQMTSNPAWYAVMSLPYLMEHPHECSEQVFNRLYANLLARHIATSDPKIERVFELWRNQPRATKDNPGGRDALASPLQQNEELASIALTETPWVLEAESEAESRRNVGILFDQNRVNDQVARLTRRLGDLQFEDGSWPWFAGGQSNSFITLYVTTGYGRLRHLGVEVDTTAAIKSLAHLDAFSKKMYDEIKPGGDDQNHLSSTIAMYLYGRSFFLQDTAVAENAQTALNFWLDQAATHWLSLPRMSQAHVAVALKRFGRVKDALPIVASVKERSLSDEVGMHWNDEVRGWFWYQADIETQAMMIEMFDEVVSDQPAVESCKAWLLRQKETRSWETTKATADAVYALLLRGVDLLADQTLVDVKVGEQAVAKQNVEAGTGFYEQRFEASEITPEMGSIQVTKTTPGIAWGGVHWKFFQNIDEITPHEGTPLKIEKQLFVVRSTPSGEVLRPVVDGLVAGDAEAGQVDAEAGQVDADGTPIGVGDEIVSRLIVRTTRAMEFIHLKDSRGSGTEPSNVLSGYRRQDGLGYYQSTRDAAEHFFIDYLPEGTYVLESRSRVQLKGRYQSGLATIESMYAPQYNSHSESHLMKVGE